MVENTVSRFCTGERTTDRMEVQRLENGSKYGLSYFQTKWRFKDFKMVEICSLVSILENVFSDKMGFFENTVSRFCTEERTVFSDKMEVQGFEDAWLKIRVSFLYT